jgi:hypothetical protein
MRRLIGVGFRRFIPNYFAFVELWGSGVRGRVKHGAEMVVATDVGVDAHPIRVYWKVV